MADVILDAFLDSLKIFAVVAVCTYIIAFIEPYLAKKVRLESKLAPLIGVSISLLPQCGFSVVAADLYQKRHITVGTLIGVFLATSDEAMPIFLSYPDKALHVLPLIAIKFAVGLIMGYLIDFLFTKQKKEVSHHIEHCNDEYLIRLTHCESAEAVPSASSSSPCDCDECVHSQCHSNHIQNQNEGNNSGILSGYILKLNAKKQRNEKIKRFVLNPIFHSIEVFFYVFVINIVFGIIIYFIGEENIIQFLTSNKYIAPLFSVLVGAIPNCASSIILSELYIMGGLGFGAALGGLFMNAGLGFLILFKNKKFIKNSVLIFLSMLLISIVFSYIFSLIFSFGTLPF